MTIKDLSQLSYLSKEIVYLQKKLLGLEDCMDSLRANDYVKGSSALFPFILHDIKVEGIVPGGSAKLPRLRGELQRTTDAIRLQLDKAITEYADLSAYIAEIDDCLLRQIISLRFLDGLKWRDVAQHIGGGNSDKSVQMLLKRFLATH